MTKSSSVLAFLLVVFLSVAHVAAAEPTFDQHVAAQRAIEQVYWAHRVWPAGSPTPKPALSAVLSDADLRAKLARSFSRQAAVESELGRAITRAELQAEVKRMIRESRSPDVLDELFAALGRDPVLIEDVLARPLVAEKLAGAAMPDESQNAVTCESWLPTATAGAPAPRSRHTAIWTGAEMIVWGGASEYWDTPGYRYDPATDGWTLLSTVGAPNRRYNHTAVWTGQLMIVWGGFDDGLSRTGGRYDVLTDTWAATSEIDAPTARHRQVAVWTGSEMLVWGGCSNGSIILDPKVHRYRPDTDSWTTSASSGPTGQCGVAGVWTGSELLLWGTLQAVTAHRYAPATDTWSAMSSVNSPFVRNDPSGVWTGTEMIVWGGGTNSNTGGRYRPSTDAWIPTSIVGAPSARIFHTAVWTGSDMLVWGGTFGSTRLADGARFNPMVNIWQPLPTIGAPSPRSEHSAVWTGSEMIIWGGKFAESFNPTAFLDTGGRYRTQPAPETCNGVDDDCNGSVDEGVSCDDGNACNGLESCAGTNGCVAGTPVVCAPPDPCHVAGMCQAGSGTCTYDNQPDGTPCIDGDSGTIGDVCTGGVCAGTPACNVQPAPKSAGYYKKLCEHGVPKPSHSDALTDADAVCVGRLTSTFAGITTAPQICAVYEKAPGGIKECEKGEDELMGLALNICRQRVCETQEIDSACGNDHDSHHRILTTVAASAATADGLLSDPARSKITCQDATCLAKEINNGKGIHQVSLTLAKVPGGGTRLAWGNPIMDDGSGEASSYTIWRRPLNAEDTFVKLTETTGLNWVDNDQGTTDWEYEVTFTIRP